MVHDSQIRTLYGLHFRFAVNKETQSNSDSDIPRNDFSLSEKPKWGAAGEVTTMTFLHTIARGPVSFSLAVLPSQYPASITKSKTATPSTGGRSREMEDLVFPAFIQEK